MPDVFFDLDHTLWDFDANAQQTLVELHHEYRIDRHSDISAEQFAYQYTLINDELWEQYHNNRITKDHLRTERFRRLFAYIGYSEDKIPGDFWEKYITICPTKTALIPGAKDILEYLSNSYSLHVITNGFIETQHRKLKHSGLAKYFDSITISEEVGSKKPGKFIFDYALKNAGSGNTVADFIGDSYEADVLGGINAGWRVFWLAPNKTEGSYKNHPRLTKINKLVELKSFF